MPIICDPWPLFPKCIFLVPSGPPRAVEAETVNSSAVRVKWRAPAPERQHGQIRGYQVHYVRMNYGEPQGQPFIKDILIEDSQVTLLLSQVLTYSCMPDEILPLHMQWLRLSGLGCMLASYVFCLRQCTMNAHYRHRYDRIIFMLYDKAEWPWGLYNSKNWDPNRCSTWTKLVFWE